MIAVLLFALAAAALAICLYYFVRYPRTPEGVVIYADTDARQPGKTLTSHRFSLTGKPDYLLRTPDGAITPVEVKSRSCGARGPYAGEKAQLFAYCLLVEDVMGAPVREGILQYRDRQFRLNFGEPQRREIIALLDEIHAARNSRQVARDHHDVRRCQACGIRRSCGEALS